MSELDVGLKGSTRRFFWRMGFSTRINVKMRAYVPPSLSQSKKGHEEFTDLDVLGIGLGPDVQIYTAIGDCKTTARRPTERTFWLRGVADFFRANNAYLVRSGDVPAAVRQLAARLRLSVITPGDLAALEDSHPSPPEMADGRCDFLFDPKSIIQHSAAMGALDRKLWDLVEYAAFDYWVYDHRNLQQLVAHLAHVGKHLNPNSGAHLAVLLDCAWLYSLALCRVVEHVRRADVVHLDTSLQEYIFGGQLGLREKQALALAVKKILGRDGEAKIGELLPPYYKQLIELVTRFMRRPAVMIPALRYAEFLSAALMLGNAKPLRETFGESYNVVAGKLLGDVCSFLIGAAGVNVDFRAKVRALLAQDTATRADSPSASQGAAGASSTRPGTASDADRAPEPQSPQSSLFRPQS